MKVHHEIKIRFFAVFLHLFRRIGDGVNHLKKEMSSTEVDIVREKHIEKTQYVNEL